MSHAPFSVDITRLGNVLTRRRRETIIVFCLAALAPQLAQLANVHYQLAAKRSPRFYVFFLLPGGLFSAAYGRTSAAPLSVE